jgi:hypothetical protein
VGANFAQEGILCNALRLPLQSFVSPLITTPQVNQLERMVPQKSD